MTDIPFRGLAPAASLAGPAAPLAPAVKAKETAAPAPAPEPVHAPRIDPQQLHRQLEEAVAELNKQMEHTGRALGFSIDDALGQGRSIVKVVNKDTGELVRQIPSEDIVRVAHSIESLKGLLYNQSI